MRHTLTLPQNEQPIGSSGIKPIFSRAFGCGHRWYDRSSDHHARDFAPRHRRTLLAPGEISTDWILVLITRVDSRHLMRRTQNRATWYYIRAPIVSDAGNSGILSDRMEGLSQGLSAHAHWLGQPILTCSSERRLCKVLIWDN